MSDKYKPTSNLTYYQPVQCYYNHYQYLESTNKAFLTNEELDYLENVISKNYSLVPNRGYLSFNGYCNNTNSVNSLVDTYNNSEPSFKGQLSKYFPESIRSNFNDAIDFNELKASELLVSDFDLQDVTLNELYEDSNETDVNSNNDILNSNPSSNSNSEMIHSNFLRSNSVGEESLDFTNQIIKKEQNEFNINANKISMINRRRSVMKKLPKEKKIICSKLI
jgi:hypothetical protein